jgi:phosphoglycerate kinase
VTGRWLSDAPLEGRRVFLRADLNVPVENGRVADDTRLTAVLPTIRTILGRGASIVLASHLGRPDGHVVPGMSLAPVAERLSQLLGSKVLMAPDSIGRRVETMASGLKPGDVLLLENLRFHPGEEQGDPGFARSLAALADIYVNDAFGTCHRAHASMTGVPAVLGGGYAGLLVQKELDFFSRAVDEPARPFTLLLGGAKVSDKVPVIEYLIEKVDSILIGGGMAFTFLRAAGLDVGRSLLEEDMVAKASSLVEMARKAGGALLLPVDVVAAPGPDAGASAVAESVT